MLDGILTIESTDSLQFVHVSIKLEESSHDRLGSYGSTEHTVAWKLTIVDVGMKLSYLNLMDHSN